MSEYVIVAFCPEVVEETSKGTYTWPRAGYNSRPELPCKSGDKSGDKAYYTCNGEGKWVDLDVEACKYSNSITQILHDLSLVSIVRM